MRLRHISPAFLAAFASLAFAAEVRLGREVPVVPDLTAGPAAYSQKDPAIASNGRGFVAVWYDGREQSTRKHLYVTSLDAEGNVIERYGRRIKEADDGVGPPLIASTGDGYLIVWSLNGHRHVQALDENGLIAGIERELDSSIDAYHLISNGSTYLLIASEDQEDVALSFDREGVLLRKTPLQLRFRSVWSATVSEGHYTVVGRNRGCNPFCTAELRTIDDHAGSLTVTATTLPVSFPANAAVTITANHILFAQPWSGSEGEVQFGVYDRAQNQLRPSGFLKLPKYAEDVEAVWDGKEFLIMAVYAWGPLSVARVRPDGTLVAPPYRLSSTAKALPAFASNGVTRILMWQDVMFSLEGDLLRRAVHDFAELADTPQAVSVLASGHAQTEVQLAWTPTAVMSAWRDDGPYEIHAVINGADLLVDRQTERRVGTPSVTAAGNRFLVAWYDSAATARLLARRFALDGSAIDVNPIVLRSDLSKLYLDDTPGVSADGSSFVITDDSDGFTLLRLDGETGVVSEISKTPCPDIPANFCWGSFAPIRTASEWVLPYVRYYGFFSPHVEVTWGIGVLQTPLSGSGIRNTNTPMSGNGSKCVRAGVAHTSDRLTIAMPQYAAIQVLQGPLSGSVEPGIRIPQSADAYAAGIAWNGLEYVLAWATINGGPIRAIRLDKNGQLLDNAPFEIAPQGATISAPSVVATDHGVIIAYSRSARENGGAPRAFTRTLDAIPTIARRPSVRH